jgi:colanic acid biosynthesis glycosyl transferase WcaI
MKFVLYSLNYSPELTGIGKYNGEMCPQLARLGMEITAVVAPPYYPQWQVAHGYSSFGYQHQVIDGVNIIRCPLYVPKKLTTLKRLIHLSSFAFSSGLALLGQLFKSPDVIFLVQPTFFCAPIALLVAKLTGAKAVMHIQDFEVDAMFGLGMMSEGRLAKIIRSVESFFLKRFDVVSSISYSMLENAKRKGVAEERLLFFPNWADTNFVNPTIDGSAIRQEFGFAPHDKIVLYAGNIGAKQGLEIVLDAAQHFTNNPDVKFVFVGAGAYVDTLQAMTKSKGLSNVVFKPLQPWERVPEMLAMADVHLVVQRKGAADAVLPSKLTNILSAGGHALVTAESETELGALAEKHPEIYQLVEPENSAAFITGLEALLAKDLTQPNRVARQYAEQYLDKSVILERFHQDMLKLASQYQFV